MVRPGRPADLLRSTTVPSTATGFGIDYAQGSTFFLAMEARWTHHLDDVADPFLTRQDVVEAGLLARMSLANERLQINAASIGNWTFRSWLARPEVRYVVDDASLGVGAVIIGVLNPKHRLTSSPPSPIWAVVSAAG